MTAEDQAQFVTRSEFNERFKHLEQTLADGLEHINETLCDNRVATAGTNGTIQEQISIFDDKKRASTLTISSLMLIILIAAFGALFSTIDTKIASSQKDETIALQLLELRISKELSKAEAELAQRLPVIKKNSEFVKAYEYRMWQEHVANDLNQN